MPDDKGVRALEAVFHACTRAGFHGVTTAGVARAAGLATGTLFARFPTKEALFAAALDEATARLTRGVLAQPPDPTDFLYLVLGRAWEALARRALAEPAAFAYWALYWATPGVPRGEAQRPFPPLRTLDEALAQRLGVSPAEGRALHALFVLHWQGAVRWAQARVRAHGPDTFLEGVFRTTFDAWWELVGLPKNLPLRGEAPPLGSAPAPENVPG